MRPVVTVVDYGMGNLLSVARALEKCGAEVRLESSPLFVPKADRLVLPGVGAFGDAMVELRQRDLVEPIAVFAASGRPLLGICLGMQLLLDGSDEFGTHAGLGLVPGWVRRLPEQDGIKLPHIGWSAIRASMGRNWSGTILEGISCGQEFYFVHSYGAVPSNPKDSLAETAYGESFFSSVVSKDNVTGTQFHPEKSGEVGLAVIRNFLNS